MAEGPATPSSRQEGRKERWQRGWGQAWASGHRRQIWPVLYEIHISTHTRLDTSSRFSLHQQQSSLLPGPGCLVIAQMQKPSNLLK